MRHLSLGLVVAWGLVLVWSGAWAWQITINGTLNANDSAGAVTVDGGGDVVAAGSINNTGTGEDFAVVKLRGADGGDSDPGEAQGGVRAFGARVRRRLIVDPDPQPQGILHEMKDAIAALGDLPAQSLRQVLSHRILGLPHRPPPSAQGLSDREESGRQIEAWTYVLISTELLCAP
jgi:hypothetical protein